LETDVPAGTPLADTVLVRISPLNDELVKKLAAGAQRVLVFAQTRSIQTDEQATQAANDLAMGSTMAKQIDTKRKEYTEPLNVRLKEINAAFKSITDPLDQADKLTRGSLLAYRAQQEARAEAIKRANDLRVEAAQLEAANNGTGEITETVTQSPVPFVLPTTMHADMGAATTLKTRKHRVIDFAKLPDLYKVENTSLLAAVAKKDLVREIAGVEFYYEASLRVTPRKGE